MSDTPTTLICYCNWAHSFGVSICFWLPGPLTQRTKGAAAVFTFPIHLQYEGQGIAIRKGRSPIPGRGDEVVTLRNLKKSKPKVKPCRFERARELQAILDAHPEMTRADLARKLGISRAAITKALRPLKESDAEAVER